MQSNTFNLALLDINLPDTDGVTLSQQLKVIAKEKGDTLVTIAVSAHVFNEDITKFISSGFDGFVAKPVQMKKLKPCIAKVMFKTVELIGTDIEKSVEIELDNDEVAKIRSKESHNLFDQNEFPIFDANIPNQDTEYLGNQKVKQLTELFCQQVNSEYSDFSNLSAIAQEEKLHKLKGAAIGLGLVRLYELCKHLEVSTKHTKLDEKHLLMLEALIHLSKNSLRQYAQTL
jgi:two-component system sensor histidine kinase TorS